MDTAATGVVPETSVVIVEQVDGEGTINIKNTDAFPVLLLTSLKNVKGDTESLLTVTPPAARVEPGKVQSVRFIMLGNDLLKTERLKRVTFEGIPPQLNGKNEVRVTVRQNLPVLIRPAGLPKDNAPWKHLVWKYHGNSMTVNNPSPYVVRLGQNLKTLPDNIDWILPESYILPGQSITVSPEKNKKGGIARLVRFSPATTWGYSVNTYDAELNH
jgi:P pilus assembly chaperone PapD